MSDCADCFIFWAEFFSLFPLTVMFEVIHNISLLAKGSLGGVKVVVVVVVVVVEVCVT